MYYKGAIWTNHALQRLNQRGLSQEMAAKTFQNPERSLKGKEPGTWEYVRKFENSYVTVIAKQNEKREWLILSCWIDPPLYGTIDYKKREDFKKYQKASVWGKIWMSLWKQLFG